MRELTTTLDNILDLINCAEDYGFYDDVLLCAFANLMKYQLSDEEIENYAKIFLTPEYTKKGYSEEDYEAAIERLKEFKTTYIK